MTIRLLKRDGYFGLLVATADIAREPSDLPQLVTWRGRVFVLDGMWLDDAERRPAYFEAQPLALADEQVRNPEGKS